MANLFVFDIETVPDVEAGQRFHELPDMEPHDIAQAMFQLRRQESGHDFLPHYLQKIVAISVVIRTSKFFKVWSLGEIDASEKELLQRFFSGIEKYTPTLISWNGSNFDLPVIHYRSLLHNVSGKTYWENGESDNQFRWNNYLNRYHERHTDLMDVLSSYQARATASLNKIATLLGFPGKMGMSGDKVWDYYQQGRLEEIRSYCETDVLNTYLVYLRFQVIRGKLPESEYLSECALVKDTLTTENKPHFTEFLENWSTHDAP